MRLIDTELEITVEASSKETFSVKIHPGRAKVCDVLEQLERKLEVPIKDQKLYHGRTRLSDSPRNGLPCELICSPRPTVVVIVPEYIHITVKDHHGDSHDIKIDKEKSLTALMEELPSRGKKVTFAMGERVFNPEQDKGLLQGIPVVP